MHDVHAVRVGQRQLVGELAGAVGAAVVDDEDVHVGQAACTRPTISGRFSRSL